ncbi:DUF3021 family protein [Alkalibaculum bacchi]|uniref:DUF3021 family protein n=1 Tax=Alkalibaculum bacchi TaxID=645887 RepID=A0A366IBY5_9FIRM|nr:DUF3021 family protein [Alkalibaculum bacchi]RBP66779.1 DUF3021 family protein [Alkalibaculum bacchi]
MKFLDLIRQLIRDYFVIFGILIIGTVFLTPPNTINRDYILLAMVFAAVGDLPSIVFWSKSELTENSRRLRILIHFILLEAVILIFGGITSIVSGFMEYLIFAIEIVVIYVIVRLITWRGDLATAKRINEKLIHLKRTDKYE